MGLLTFSSLAQKFNSISYTATNHTKLSNPSYQAIERSTENEKIALFIKGDCEKVKLLTESVGGIYKYGRNNISAISISKNKLSTLLNDKAVNRIEATNRKAVLLNDSAVVNNGILPIHTGQLPLTQGYDGTGVIIGVIDSGIDIDHPDFKNTDSTSRILFIWDQPASGDTNRVPQPYNYGQEWTNKDIDTGACTHTDYDLNASHGTNVAGIAAGNGLGSGKYSGMAPKADIIIVATNYSLDSIIDAVDYIFKKADSLGKPCVVNLSLGDYFGSHDGKDIYAQAIDAMVTEKPGRSVVCAGGNAASYNFHLGYEVEPDSAFTWFQYFGAIGGVGFYLWADTADFNNVQFSVGADNPTTLDYKGRIPYKTITDILDQDVYDTLYDGGNRIGIINTTAYLINDSSVYEMIVYVIPDSTNLYWRFITKGEGKFDSWTSTVVIGSSDMISTGLPDTTSFPDIKRYRMPDNRKTITSSWTCSDKTITVATYNNRYDYINVDLDTIVFPDQPPGSIGPNSSLGPTRDDRIKPDIAASGNGIITTGSNAVISTFLGNGNRFKVSDDTLHMRNGGTSMASPIVAGFVALYLQKNPNADYKEIKDVIMLGAKIDSFTGSTPNDNWGHGKLNGYTSIITNVIYGCMDTGSINYIDSANIDDSSCIAKVYGCTDTSAINYNSSANVDNGSCIAKIYGCMDSTAFNYDSLANIDDGSCIYDFILNPSEQTILEVYPNPFKNQTIIRYYSLKENLSLEIVTIQGKVIDKKNIVEKAGSIPINLNTAEGIYYCILKSNSHILSAQKIVLY